MRLPTLLAAAVATAALAVPAAASADTLDGTQFVSANASEAFTFSGECNPSGPSTFTWYAVGEATGPHAGSFSEYGTVTLASPSGPVTGFEATYELWSGEDLITGTKTIDGQGTGTCSTDQLGSLFEAKVDATYDVLDPFTETGPAQAELTGSYWSGTFVERFGAKETPPPPAGPKTKDDCKNGGWATFGFPNQGLCVKAVNHQP